MRKLILLLVTILAVYVCYRIAVQCDNENIIAVKGVKVQQLPEMRESIPININSMHNQQLQQFPETVKTTPKSVEINTFDNLMALVKDDINVDNKNVELPKQVTTVTQPRYKRLKYIKVTVLITFYAWNEPNELKWKGKTATGKSAKNDWGCATLWSQFPKGSEVYFPFLKDYRVIDDTFDEDYNWKFLAKHKWVTVYHIDIRLKDKSEIPKYARYNGLQTVYVQTKLR